MPSSTTSTAWRLVNETLHQHRADCAAFAVEIESVLAGVETLRGQVRRQGAALSEERQSLAGVATASNDQSGLELVRLRAELDQARAERDESRRQLAKLEEENHLLTAAAVDVVGVQKELAAARGELAQARQDLAAARQELADKQAQWLEQLRAQPQAAPDGDSPAWRRSEEEFAAFRDRLERSLDECAKWASAAASATETREELAALRAELQSRPLSEGAPEGIERNGDWERERGALETELELVRARAAELYESLTRQERGLTELRSELGGDIQQLRRLLESQAELLTTRAADAPRREAAASHAVADVEAGASDPSDPMLTSVMAQFARLQQDVAERRKKKKP
jgi:DNA repair exonuclease SbcCD ATPase subunit